MRASGAWDLLVVGGGTAGLVAARTAARFGAKVALVERDRTGGDCLWTGCVPSKALLAAADLAARARAGAALGVHVGDVRVDFPAVMRHVGAAIAHIEPVDSVAALQRAGVTVVQGEARFTGPRTVAAGGRELVFRRALVATGAAPVVPDVPGLREARPLTSDTVWTLPRLPDRLVVLGGGSIGCELGQAFARLGARVTLVEALPRVLGREDPDAAALVHRRLVEDGVEVLTGHRAVRVDPGGTTGGAAGPGASAQAGRIMLSTGGTGGTGAAVDYDALLVAVGRAPRSGGLGLDRAGVLVDEQGFVTVDERLRTSNPRVFAAGDVTAHPQLTHVAGVHGSLAAVNAVLGLRRRVDRSAVPRVTFTDPEVAAVGRATWAEPGAPSGPPTLVTRHHDEVDRAVAEGRTEGFARLVLAADGSTVVGATVVGPRAGESLAELTLAVRRRLSVTMLAGTMHAYPTYGDGPWLAAVDRVTDRLAEPRARAVTAGLLRLRRLASRVR